MSGLHRLETERTEAGGRPLFRLAHCVTLIRLLLIGLTLVGLAALAPPFFIAAWLGALSGRAAPGNGALLRVRSERQR